MNKNIKDKLSCYNCMRRERDTNRCVYHNITVDMDFVCIFHLLNLLPETKH